MERFFIALLVTLVVTCAVYLTAYLVHSKIVARSPFGGGDAAGDDRSGDFRR